jgi:sec-independent protein translocase protein TatC
VTDTEPDTTAKDKTPESSSMTVLDHLAELRSTLMWALGMAFAAAIAAWFVSDWIIETLLAPVQEAGQETLYFQAPMEGFLLKLKASAVMGLLFVLPLILYKIYSFVMPGLLPKEKRIVTPLLVSATGLFYVGVGFCYVVLLPLVIRFALSFATESLQPWLTASSYFDLAARLCLAFGLLFELPMVVFALSWVGVVDPRTLLKGWRYAFLLILGVSALLTPPDIISQVLLGGPVMLLYIVSVLISMLVRKRQRESKERELELERQEEMAYRKARAQERKRQRELELEQERAERGETAEPEDDAGSDAGEGETKPPAPEARPAPGAEPRVDEAPDRDPDAEDPPWVRPKPPTPTGSGDEEAGDGPSDDDGGDGSEDRDPDDRESN